ncbi:hypothetical protein H9P43_007992 [Blastocladiella emersonii ATCC 22665]|nr:hypothetical protein H9P43_007992 [Blastocladiella emersonii ATCC 22665]
MSLTHADLAAALADYDRAAEARALESADPEKYRRLHAQLHALDVADPDHRHLDAFGMDLLPAFTDWKLLRGRHRPTLQTLILENDEPHVLAVTRRVLADLRACPTTPLPHTVVVAAIDALAKALRGVGPATAALILSFFSTDIPLMSDELLHAAKHKMPYRYSLKEYRELLAYVDSVIDVADPEADTTPLSRRDVERAIWTKAVLDRHDAHMAMGAPGVSKAKDKDKAKTKKPSKRAAAAAAAEDSDGDHEPAAKRTRTRRLTTTTAASETKPAPARSRAKKAKAAPEE